jgi:hypothetical protein
MNQLDKCEQRLVACGWYPGRKVDVRLVLQELSDAGFSIEPVIMEFLQEFSGLRVCYPSAFPDVDDILVIDASAALATLDRLDVRWYERGISEKLVPVGLAFYEHMTVLLGASGKLYCVFDDTVLCLGSDPRAGMAALCTGDYRKLESFQLRELWPRADPTQGERGNEMCGGAVIK